MAMTGKISHVEALQYTPTGRAILEFTLVVPQEVLEKKSMGYFNIVLVGSQAEAGVPAVRIGKQASVRGTLWRRSFRNRRGDAVTETKILADSMTEGEKR